MSFCQLRIILKKAFRMMERALMITQRSELEHPALALDMGSREVNTGDAVMDGDFPVALLLGLSPLVHTEEACKVRLNFAAYLSEGYRNREAVKVIKDIPRIKNRA